MLSEDDLRLLYNRSAFKLKVSFESLWELGATTEARRAIWPKLSKYIETLQLDLPKPEPTKKVISDRRAAIYSQRLRKAKSHNPYIKEPTE